jgi:hypothetical protein
LATITYFHSLNRSLFINYRISKRYAGWANDIVVK